MERANGKLIERTDQACELSDDELNLVAGGMLGALVRAIRQSEFINTLLGSTGDTCPK
jgi:hypothetical protein